MPSTYLPTCSEPSLTMSEHRYNSRDGYTPRSISAGYTVPWATSNRDEVIVSYGLEESNDDDDDDVLCAFRSFDVLPDDVDFPPSSKVNMKSRSVSPPLAIGSNALLLVDRTSVDDLHGSVSDSDVELSDSISFSFSASMSVCSIDDEAYRATALEDEHRRNSRRRRRPRVRFTSVEVREYAVVVGDHPHCTSYPLSLDWKHTESHQMQVDEYEEQRRLKSDAPKTGQCRRLSEDERLQRLYHVGEKNESSYEHDQSLQDLDQLLQSNNDQHANRRRDLLLCRMDSFVEEESESGPFAFGLGSLGRGGGSSCKNGMFLSSSSGTFSSFDCLDEASEENEDVDDFEGSLLSKSQDSVMLMKRDRSMALIEEDMDELCFRRGGSWNM